MCYCAQFSKNVNIIYNCAPKVFFCKNMSKFFMQHKLKFNTNVHIMYLKSLALGLTSWSIFCDKFDMQYDISNIIL